MRYFPRKLPVVFIEDQVRKRRHCVVIPKPERERPRKIVIAHLGGAGIFGVVEGVLPTSIVRIVFVLLTTTRAQYKQHKRYGSDQRTNIPTFHIKVFTDGENNVPPKPVT